MTHDDYITTLEHDLAMATQQLKHQRVMDELTRHCLEYLHCLAHGTSTMGTVQRLAEAAPALLAVWREIRTTAGKEES